MQNNRQVGDAQETRTVSELEKLGYKILQKNFRCRVGEIDIVALHKGYLVFVEVKLRKKADFAAAREYVNRAKQDRLRVTASMYLSQNPSKLQPRFDVVEIYAPEGAATKNPEITHLEDAFQ